MNWQPMESAPKDCRILLYYDTPMFTSCSFVVGEWCDDRFSQKPRPYWKNDLERLSGVLKQRQYQPTLWAELELPVEENNGNMGTESHADLD